jgi:hypothetical protein
MQVSGIGGGAAAMGGGAIGGAQSSTAGGAIPTAASGTAAAGSAQLQNLVDMMGGFNSAEILMALMLASAMSKGDDEESGSAAMGFLAGLAMAGQLGQDLNISIEMSGCASPTGGEFGGGQGLNVQA